jgi:hypothetical protein
MGSGQDKIEYIRITVYYKDITLSKQLCLIYLVYISS